MSGQAAAVYSGGVQLLLAEATCHPLRRKEESRGIGGDVPFSDGCHCGGLGGAASRFAYDVTVSVGASCIEAFCTTRRANATVIPFSRVTDIYRRLLSPKDLPTLAALCGNNEAVLIEYTATLEEAMGGGTGANRSSSKKWLCALLCPSRDVLNGMFTACVRKWAFVRVGANTAPIPNMSRGASHTAGAASFAPHQSFSPLTVDQSSAAHFAYKSGSYRGDTVQHVQHSSFSQQQLEAQTQAQAQAQAQAFAYSAADSSPEGYPRVPADVLQCCVPLGACNATELEGWAQTMMSRRHLSQQQEAISLELEAIQRRRRLRQHELVVSLAPPEENEIAYQAELMKRAIMQAWPSDPPKPPEPQPPAPVVSPSPKPAPQTSANVARSTSATAGQAGAAQQERELSEVSDKRRDSSGPTVEDVGRRCVWCDKKAPSEHDAKCAERRVLCPVCHEVLLLKDKRAHRATCVKVHHSHRRLNDTSGRSSPWEGG